MLAGAVVACGAVLTVGSHYEDGLRSCHPVPVAASPDSDAPAEVVEVCQPLGAESLVLPLLFAGLLLLPDLSELSVAGLVTLKQRVAQQENAIGDTRAEVTRLASQVTSLQMALNSASALAASSASSTFTINVFDAIRERLETLSEKERVASEAGVSVVERSPSEPGEEPPTTGREAPSARPDGSDTSTLSSRFLALADQIADARDHPATVPVVEGDVDRAKRWSVLYAAEIELVLRVRDALREGGVAVGADEVFVAYQLASRVIAALSGAAK